MSALRTRYEPGLVYRAVLALDGFSNGLTMAMMALYFMHVARLDPAQMVLLGSIFEITILLFEVPTGVVADVYSRKASVLVGYFLTAVAYWITGTSTPFAMLAVGAVAWGIGETFLSGAREAWIADELPHGKRQESAEHVFVAGAQWALIARVAGCWTAVWLLGFGFHAPLVCAAVMFAVTGLVMAVFAPERGFTKQEGHKHDLGAMKATLAVGFGYVRRHAVVATIVLTTFAIGLTSEAMDRLWPRHLEESFKMPGLFGSGQVWWAVLNSATLLLSYAVLGIVRKRVRLSSGRIVATVIFWMVVCVMAGMLVFGLTRDFGLAVFGFLLVRGARRAIDPLMNGWLSRQAEPSSRATLLSFSGQAHSFGEVMSGPAFGFVAKYASITASLVASSAVLAPLLAVIGARILRTVPDDPVSS